MKSMVPRQSFMIVDCARPSGSGCAEGESSILLPDLAGDNIRYVKCVKIS
jgi:hypothetical protein